MKALFRPNKSALLHCLPIIVIGCSVAILALTIYLAQQHLRSHLRRQLVAREAQAVFALWAGHWAAKASDASDWNSHRPADQLAAILETSQLRHVKGLLGTRLFDLQGNLVVAVPSHLADARIPDEEWQSLKAFSPLGRFHSAVHFSDLFLAKPGEQGQSEAVTPILDIKIPLTTPDEANLVGAAQLIFDGHSLAAEYANLDHRLWLQSIVIFLVSGSVLGTWLGASFHWLKVTRIELAERTARLVEADRAVSRSCGTSAIGAVTANLIDTLQSRVVALDTLVSRCGRFATDWQTNPWQEAAENTRRIRAAVIEANRVITEMNAQEDYTVALSEFVELIPVRIAAFARQHGVDLTTEVHGDGLLFNKQANVVALVLTNFIRTVVEAAGSKQVRLKLAADDSAVRFEVRDCTRAVAAKFRSRLSGQSDSPAWETADLRMAISQELAKHIGGKVQFRAESSAFVLSLPWQRHSVERIPKQPITSFALACLA